MNTKTNSQNYAATAKTKSRKDIREFARIIHKSQVQRAKTHTHKKVEYTKIELYEWIILQPSFNNLYINWVESGYNTPDKPSVDRIDNSKGYSFNNIQLMTFRDNKLKSDKDIRRGTLAHGVNPVKEVSQYTKDNVLINTYISLMEAQRITGVPNSNIVKCCKNIRKTAGGFKWEYTESQ